MYEALKWQNWNCELQQAGFCSDSHIWEVWENLHLGKIMLYGIHANTLRMRILLLVVWSMCHCRCTTVTIFLNNKSSCSYHSTYHRDSLPWPLHPTNVHTPVPNG